jgi:hypothetical protein|nr:hypothetical protein [Pseudomonas sp.]
MATSAQNTPPQPIQHPGLIVSTISLMLRIIGLLLFWGDQGKGFWSGINQVYVSIAQ